jgi:FAD synthase
LGEKIGFPTINLKWPDNIYKIPYGVYKGTCFGKPAAINFGIPPQQKKEERFWRHIF